MLTSKSAVDAHVGRHLFEEALIGDLGRDRTRILVTHHVDLVLSKASYAVLLGDQKAEHAGPVAKLQQTVDLSDAAAPADEFTPDQSNEAQAGLLPSNDLSEGDSLRKILSTVTEVSVKVDEGELDFKGKSQPKKFVEDETRERGAIKLGVWKSYLQTCGGFSFWISLALLFIAYQAIILGRSWWISLWTKSYETTTLFFQQFPYQHAGSSQVEVTEYSDLKYYLGIYVALSIVICIIGPFRYLFVFMGSIKASRQLFDQMLFSVLRAPLRWLDTVPVGRILNRFTADFAAVDSKIGGCILFECWAYADQM